MSNTRRTIASALVALAATAPVAAAQPLLTERGYESNSTRGYVRGYVPQKHQAAEITSRAPDVRTVVVQQPTGFDWLDAAIGAAVAAGVLGLSGAALLIVRRSPDDAGAPLGAH
jgi:hypothetical protein